MYFDEFKHQLPDIDPEETAEWLASFDQLVEQEGESRARFLVYKLLKRARQLHVGLPPLTQTRYINTISPEQEPFFPGDESLELRIRRIIRWNAVAMVLRANTQFSGIGGHLATYASRGVAVRGRLQPLLQGQGRRPARRPDLLPGPRGAGHLRPGVPRGPALTEDQLDHFRRETDPGEGLPSYPHPRLMPDFWEYPTVSMGLGPISAIYQARFNRYLQNRGQLDTSGSRVWAFLGDGETDEPESLGALHVASREGLDNLTFVVNCNLQRLDGPVRGNGKIIQELESAFRGAGWNVIKVIWAREWDELLARDVDGVLVQQMNDTLDGEFQKYSVAGGAYIREHFFGPDPRLRKLVEHLSDDDLAKLRRGGHDYRKVYAAYKAATEYKGAPTVILAKTVKGWTLGPGVEARNITHQAKKLSRGGAEDLPRPPRAADPGCEAQGRPVLPPRARLGGGPVPPRAAASARWRRSRSASSARRPLPAPAESVDKEFAAGSETPVSTTMVFTRILRNLIRDKELGPRIVPIIPDEARTFGMDPLFKEVGIYAALGQRYEPVDSELVLSYREAVDGQVLEEGITEAGSMASLQAAATSYATPRPPDDPVLHLLLDVRLPADRRPDLGAGRRPRPRLHDGRDRRPDDAHRRGPPARRRPHPHPRLDRPELPRLRPGLRLRARGDRPRRHRADVRRRARTSSTTSRSTTRTTPSRRSPRASTRGSSGASTGSARRPTWAAKAHRARLVGSGSILQQAVAAQELLAEKFGIAAEVYSAPSFPLLRRDALEAERWNRLHPDRDAARAVRRVGPRARRRPDHRRDRLAEGPARHGLALAAAVLRGARHRRVRAERHARSRCGRCSRSTPPHVAAATLAELARCEAMPGAKAAAGDQASWASTRRSSTRPCSRRRCARRVSG